LDEQRNGRGRGTAQHASAITDREANGENGTGLHFCCFRPKRNPDAVAHAESDNRAEAEHHPHTEKFSQANAETDA